ncbi:MAG: hypothetical protein JXA25_08570 [Anaerolineales bacterium]|nr:hypothetical protein [Anaerolineales bacterium]
MQPALFGQGSRAQSDSSQVQLVIPPGNSGYTNAQIDDYHNLPRSRFCWSPPIRLSLEAQTTEPSPPGTLGFGFWNDPFTLSIGQAGTTRRFPALPQALWFFYGSPPNDFGFHQSSEPRWRAVSIQSVRFPALFLAPAAAIGFLLTTIPVFRKHVIRTGLRLMHTDEKGSDVPMNTWHHYELEWMADYARFYLDGTLLLQAPKPPHGPLGFIAWIDNQYAVVSPENGIRFGTLEKSTEQSLHLRNLTIRQL